VRCFCLPREDAHVIVRADGDGESRGDDDDDDDDDV